MAPRAKILHITPHLGGGVGTVIRGWLGRVQDKPYSHKIICLDTCNEKSLQFCDEHHIKVKQECHLSHEAVREDMERADIVLVHYWDHPMLQYLFAYQPPPARLLFWCHKRFHVMPMEFLYPDVFVATSRIIKPFYSGLIRKERFRVIWSTGGVDRFLKIKPKKHEGFNIGYIGTVDYKKMSPRFMQFCERIDIPDVQFLVIGENKIGEEDTDRVKFLGHVDDLTPYLETMDAFGYPLVHNHYGTCEQSLGEAMAAGVPPVVLNRKCERTIIKNGRTGLRAKTFEEYVDSMHLLYYEPWFRKGIAQRARVWAKELYSMTEMIKRWNFLFEEMMYRKKVDRGIIL